MVDIANLAKTINEMLSRMDSHFKEAKEAMGIKPDLTRAKEHAMEAHAVIEELGILVLQAKALGIVQPPDVVKHVNHVHEEVDDLMSEIAFCSAVKIAGDKRPKSPTKGKGAAN